MKPTPPSTPRQQDAGHENVATPPTALFASQYNEAMNAISQIALHSPITPKTPKSCRSVWQAHGGWMALLPISAQNPCYDMPTQVLNYEPVTPKGKRSRMSPPLLDKNGKPKEE